MGLLPSMNLEPLQSGRTPQRKQWGWCGRVQEGDRGATDGARTDNVAPWATARVGVAGGLGAEEVCLHLADSSLNGESLYSSNRSVLENLRSQFETTHFKKKTKERKYV